MNDFSDWKLPVTGHPGVFVGDSGPCQGHDAPCENTGTWQRQNTRYIDDASNWVCLCEECFAAREEIWAECWREYWSSVL